MYIVPSSSDSLTQADIIDDCPLFSLNPGETDPSLEPERFAARVLLVTQACDLAQSKSDRAVVAVVHKVQDLVDRHIVKPAVVRDQIRRGLVYGLYFLPSTNEPIEFPESIVDLRDLHTIPQSILSSLVSDGKRLCSISSPWREHLAQHFAVTYMRIGLPEPYTTDS